MKQALVTIKTSVYARQAVRLLAAQHGIKQYEVMEILLNAALNNHFVLHEMINKAVIKQP